MKNKYLPKILLLVFLFAFSVNVVFAQSLTLTYIGALSTNNQKYTEWWYSGTNITFKGMATPNTVVKIKLDADEYSATANASGEWSYYAALQAKNYAVSLTSGSETYSFTLHAGQDFNSRNTTSAGTTTETKQSTSPVPSTGMNHVAAIAVASTLFGLGVYLFKTRSEVLYNFEQKIVQDLD